MKKAIFGKLLLSIIGLVGIAAPVSAAPVYVLSLFNTDDFMHATITNSSFTSFEFLTDFGPGAGPFDFSSRVRPGTNTIGYTLESDHGGYTYGFNLTIDNVTVDSGSCGTKGVFGCNNNDTATGTVFTHSFTFQGDGSPTAGAPEPSALLLTACGLFPIAAFLRRKKARV
jgi:hypothetical protein